MKRTRLGLQIGGATACLFVLGVWAGCGGDTDTQEQAAAGSGGSAGQTQDASTDTSTGGTAGKGGGGGTGQGGTGQGGTGQGGSGEGGTAQGGAAGSGGAGACLLYHETCDPNDNQCCAPMNCVANDGGVGTCRSTQSETGPSCMGQNKDCSAIECCAGLECLDQGPNKTCGYLTDGGVAGSGGGGWEGGMKDGGKSKDGG